MPKFYVSKDIEIQAPVSKVYEWIRDFKKWEQWSPWLVAEPDCPLDYAADGKSYTWDGSIIGSGKLAISSEEVEKNIQYDLTFFKPFKSSNTTSFELEETEGGTKLTWKMVGSLPFFMFFMKKMMSAWIGCDYARGLSKIKDLAETGEVSSEIEYLGIQEVRGFNYIGVKRTCEMEEIGPNMENDLGSLSAYLEELGIQPCGNPFSIYHKWDMVKSACTYTSGIPVEEIPTDLKDSFISGTRDTAEGYHTKHTGAYKHLGNAWSGAMMHGQAKKFKQNKKIHPIEVYENDPKEVGEDNCIAIVIIPSK